MKPIPPARPGSNRSRSRSITAKSASSATCRISPPKPNENFLQPAQRLGQTGRLSWPACSPCRSPARSRRRCNRSLSPPSAPNGYDPTQHKWLMGVDANRCIGCGLCAEACKGENGVPEGPYFRTWIERYVIPKPGAGSGQTRGEAQVDSPDGGIHGFPERRCRRIRLNFPFSSRSCATCARIRPASRCVRWARPSDAPDGAVLIDPKYCIGCAFCVQACPYGSRFLNPVTKTAEKCTLCYHRITRGLKPACVEICPRRPASLGT